MIFGRIVGASAPNYSRQLSIWFMFTVVLGLSPVFIKVLFVLLKEDSEPTLHGLIGRGELFYVSAVIAFSAVGELVSCPGRSTLTTLVGGTLTMLGMLSSIAFAVYISGYPESVWGFSPRYVAALSCAFFVTSVVGGFSALALSINLSWAYRPGGAQGGVSLSAPSVASGAGENQALGKVEAGGGHVR